MAGAILAARMNRVPVIVDGYVATAAAAIFMRSHPARSITACSVTSRPSPATAARWRGWARSPLLDLGMRLGEGTGAALAAGIVKAAARTHAGMATFAEAGVSEKES